MDKRKGILAITFAFSVLLEVWVRFAMPHIYGYNGFYIWPPVDNIMHFFWGVNLFLIFIIYFRLTPLEGLLGVYAWQTGWEIFEMVGEVFQHQPVYMLDNFFFDGIKDTIVDIAGAGLGWLTIIKIDSKIKTTRVSHPLFIYASKVHIILMLPSIPIGAYILFVKGFSANDMAIVWMMIAWILAITLAIVKLRRQQQNHRANHNT